MNQVINRGTTITFTTDDDANYIKILVGKKDNSTIENVVEKVMLTFIDVKYSYEPYKANVLNYNNNIELQGVGEFKDTLNLLTGEITRRTNKIVFDGHENWEIGNYNGLTRFVCIEPLLTYSDYNEISDTIQSVGRSLWSVDETGCYIGTNHKFVVVFNSSDERYNYTLAEFKTYLQTNPITIICYSNTDITELVELSIVNQNNEEIEKLHSFNEATYVRIKVVEDSLYPNIELETKISSE